MSENRTGCEAESQVVDLLTKVGVETTLIERWQAFHLRSHNAYGAAEHADAEVDPYVDPTRFGSTPITVGQHNTICMAIGELLLDMLNGLDRAIQMSEMFGTPVDALINLEDGKARFAHLLDCVDAVDALVEAASASGSMDFVPEGWAGLS